MTIFRSIIKKKLLFKIAEYIEDSKVSDGIYGAYLRNFPLAEAKRCIAEDLKKNISELNLEVSDNAFLNQIKTYLLTAKEDAAHKVRAQGKDGGKFDDLMNYLVIMVNTIEFKLGKIELIDVKYDKNEPLSVFSYYMALYHAEAIMEKLDSKKGFYNKLMELSKGQLGIDLSDDKDALISEALKSCRKHIEALGEEKPDYKKAVLDEVLRTIREVKSNNAELCRKHGIDPQVKVRLTFFTSLNLGVQPYTPSKGKLEMYMEEAIKAIQAIDINHAPVLF